MKSPTIFLRETLQKRFWSELKHYFVILPYGRILKETGRLVACCLIMWVSLHFFRTPEHDEAVLVLKFVMISGLFCILLYPLYRSLNTYRSMLYGLTAYIAVLSSIGNFGDKLLDTPNLAVSVLFAIVLTQFISSFAQTSTSYCNPLRYYPGNYSYGTPVTPRVTVQDRIFIAAHEAGHAMVYAAFDEYPPNLLVVAKAKADNSGSLGYVQDGLKPHKLDEKTMSEWYMLLLLAGNAGERSHTGHETLGSSNDNARWLKTADSYLSNLTRGIYHMLPKTKEQIEHNESKLIALKAEQQLMLDVFFDINRSVHNDMVNELRSSTTLKGDALFKFLDRVVLPEEFPRPKKELIPD
ncbi:TPA: hypothetical protein I8Y18_003655 [Raoultella ornithinolytica]|nr:hypothetical protein [Raoultella ornithinolytica]